MKLFMTLFYSSALMFQKGHFQFTSLAFSTLSPLSSSSSFLLNSKKIHSSIGSKVYDSFSVTASESSTIGIVKSPLVSKLSRTKNIRHRSLLVELSSSSNINGEGTNNNNNNSNNTDSINGLNNNKSRNINYNLRPKTGWNHNLPSETSDFWNSNNNPKEISRTSSSSSPTSNKSTLKTGWLHNQQPAETLQKGGNDNRRSKQNSDRSTSTATSPSTTTTTPPPTTNIARLRLLYAKKQQSMNHRIVQSPTFHASTIGKHGIVVTNHMLSVPVFRATTTKPSLDRDTTSNTVQSNNNNNSNDRIDVAFTIVEAIDTKEQYDFFQSLVTSTSSTTSSSSSSSSSEQVQQNRAMRYVQNANMDNADSMVLYLQGGPGFGSPTPITGLSFSTPDSSWASKALSMGIYKRIVLLDQRGTGKSSPITKQTLQIQFPNLFLLDDDDNKINKNNYPSSTAASPLLDDDDSKMNVLDEYKATTDPERFQLVQTAVHDVVEYITQFRADNIVHDAEDIRQALLMKPDFDTPEGIEEATALVSEDQATTTTSSSTIRPKPWGCSLGQSYGGFCSLTYLSIIEHPPKVMLLTGGIAPMHCTDPMKLYMKFWDRVRQRNYMYYRMYPDDIQKVKEIVQYLEQTSTTEPILLPSGGILTARRFLQIGIKLGSSPSSFASIHETINNAFVDDSIISSTNRQSQQQQQQTQTKKKTFRRTFLKEMDSTGGSFDDAPLYYLLHESIYANGGTIPTNWAAHRAYIQKCQLHGIEFDYQQSSTLSTPSSNTSIPTLLFGEMVFPWMSHGDYKELSGIGMKAIAYEIANKSNWNVLYNDTKIYNTLQTQQTQMAAAVYYDDMYVDFDECMKLVTGSSTTTSTSSTSESSSLSTVSVSTPPPLEHCQVYITNEYQHSGLRDDGATLFTKLHGMAIRSIRTPS